MNRASMVLRTLVGAVAGAVAGAGFLLTVYPLARYCDSGPGPAGCGRAGVLLVPSLVAFWMFVAGLLIALGFRMWRQEDGRLAAVLGCGLWVGLGLAALHVDAAYFETYGDDDLRFNTYAAVIVPCVAYAIAALCTCGLRSPR